MALEWALVLMLAVVGIIIAVIIWTESQPMQMPPIQ